MIGINVNCLFVQLLKGDEDQQVASVETACKQIVDRLVQSALTATNGQSLTLYY